jgi:hypothetical protein
MVFLSTSSRKNGLGGCLGADGKFLGVEVAGVGVETLFEEEGFEGRGQGGVDEGDGAAGGDLFEQEHGEVAAEALAFVGGGDEEPVEMSLRGVGGEGEAAAGEDEAVVREDVEIRGVGEEGCEAGWEEGGAGGGEIEASLVVGGRKGAEIHGVYCRVGE